MSSGLSALINQLSNAQEQLTRYVYSVFLIFGVTGCCLNIFLLSRRQFRTSSCCTYFLAMSIIMLIHIIIALGIYLYSLDYDNPTTTISAACKARNYIVISTGMIYRWCLTIACFDRFALSSSIVRLRNFAKIQIAKRVIIIIIIIWIVLPVHVPIVYNIRNNVCGIFYNIIASLYHSIFMTITASILPTLIMSICTLLIHRNLALKRQRRQQNAPQGRKIEKLQSKRDQQVLIMLCIQMIFYVITILPLMAMYFYNALTIYITKTYDRIIIERFLLFLAELLNFLFPVCSFYLYTMASQMFRVELKTMLYTFLKCQYFNNSIRPTTEELQMRDKHEQLTTSALAPQSFIINREKIDSKIEIIQQTDN